MLRCSSDLRLQDFITHRLCLRPPHKNDKKDASLQSEKMLSSQLCKENEQKIIKYLNSCRLIPYTHFFYVHIKIMLKRAYFLYTMS